MIQFLFQNKKISSIKLLTKLKLKGKLEEHKNYNRNFNPQPNKMFQVHLMIEK